MTHGIKLRISKINKKNIVFKIYRTLPSNIDENGALLDESAVTEMIELNQTDYETSYPESVDDNKYTCYIIDSALHENWTINGDNRLYPSAVQYKAFLEFDTEYAYFIMAYRSGYFIGDSRRQKPVSSKYIKYSVTDGDPDDTLIPDVPDIPEPPEYIPDPTDEDLPSPAEPELVY